MLGKQWTKRLWIILPVMLLTLMFCTGALADFADGYYTFTVTNNYATITGYTGNDLDLVIPSQVTMGDHTYRVNAIGDGAFASTNTTTNNSTRRFSSLLRSVTMSSDVTSIGTRAFYECTALQQVRLNHTATVGTEAFSGCTSLVNVVFNGQYTTGIASKAFYGCTALKRIMLPDSITTMGTNVFENCTSLETVSFPARLTTVPDATFKNDTALTDVYNLNGSSVITAIGTEAFMNCTALKPVVLGDALTTVWNYAFYGATPNWHVTIPRNLEYVGDYAFDNITGLVVSVVGDIKSYIGVRAFTGVMTDLKDGSKVLTWAKANAAIVVIAASNDVPDYPMNTYSDVLPGLQYSTWIRTDAVTGQQYFAATILGYTGSRTDLVIPEIIYEYSDPACTLNCTPIVVEVIQGGAFAYNTTLRSVTLPATLTMVGDYAFANSNLTAVYFEQEYVAPDPWNGNPHQNPNYPANYFKLRKTPPAGVDKTGTRVQMGPGVFMNCASLTTVKLPSAQLTLPERTFYNDPAITAVDCMTDGSYSNEGTASISLPATLTSIGASAFAMPYDRAYNVYGDPVGYSSLESVELHDLTSLQTIGAEAFGNCTNLMHASLYDSVVTIGELAFFNTRAEGKLVNEVFHIHAHEGSYADSWARDHYIPRVLGDPIGLFNCGNLTHTLDSENHNNVKDFTYTIDYTAGTVEITGYIGTSSEMVIPAKINGASVTSIAKEAFMGNPIIRRVELPDTLLTIGERAFFDCYNMVDVNLGDLYRLTTIGKEAFAYTHLSYFIPFTRLTALTSVGLNAFESTAVYPTGYGYMGGAYTVMDVSSDTATKLLKGTGLGIRPAVDSPWCFTFMADGNLKLLLYGNCYDPNILKPESVTNPFYAFDWQGVAPAVIGDYAFAGKHIDKKVSAFVIPAVVKIGNGAFMDVTGLMDATEPYKTNLLIEAQEIGYDAFNNAHLISNAVGCTVSLGASVRTINAWAFANNPDLTYMEIPSTVAYISIDAFGTGRSTPLTLVVNSVSQYTAFQQAKQAMPNEYGFITVRLGAANYSEYDYRVVDGYAWLTRYNGTNGQGILLESNGVIYVPSVVNGFGVVGIDNDCFSYIPYDYNYTYGSYSGGYALRTVVIPDCIKEIGWDAFAGNDRLSKVMISGTSALQRINGYAFAECPALTSFTIPASVTYLGECVFSNSGLVNNVFGDEIEPIVIPGTVTTFDDCALYSNDGEGNLTPVRVYVEHKSPADTYVTRQGFRLDTPSTPGDFRYIDYPVATEATVFGSNAPYTLSGFDATACTDRVIVVPDTLAYNGTVYNVTTIGPNVFAGVKADVIILPSTVTTIAASAFEGSTVRYINFAELTGLNNIGARAFYNTRLIGGIEIYPSLNGFTIGANAFGGTNANKRWFAADSFANSYISKLGESNLAIRVRGGLTGSGLSDASLYDAEGLSNAGFKWSNDTIGIIRWFGTEPDADIGPMSAHTDNFRICTGAFENIQTLETVTMAGVNVIETKAFADSQGLVSVTIADTTTTIADEAFYGCNNLQVVTIPDSVTNITTRAFANCAANLVIRCHRGSVADGVFSNTNSTFRVSYIDDQDPYVDPASGLIYDLYVDINDGRRTKAMIMGYEGQNNEYLTIPATINGYPVGRITNDSLAGMKTRLKHLTIEGGNGSEGYLVIDPSAFENFTALESVTMTRKVSILQNNTFNGCYALNTVVLPEGMTAIQPTAFTGCVSLQSVTIPGTVSTIQASTFEGKTNLKNVTIKEGVKRISSRAFYGCTGLRTVSLPDSIIPGNGTIYPDIGTYPILDPNWNDNIWAFGGIGPYAGKVTIYCSRNSYAYTYFSNYNLYFTGNIDNQFVLNTGAADQSDFIWKDTKRTTKPDASNHTEEYTEKVLLYKGSATTVVVPPSVDGITVTTIYPETFCNEFVDMHHSLLNVSLPGSVLTIADEAFKDYTVLYSVTAPSVTTIGESAFENDRALRAFTFPASIQSIGKRAFYNSPATRTTPAFDSADPNLVYNLYEMVSACPTIGEDAFEWERDSGMATPRRYVYPAPSEEAQHSMIGTGLPMVSSIVATDPNAGVGFVLRADNTYAVSCWIENNLTGNAVMYPALANSGWHTSEHMFENASFLQASISMAESSVLPYHAFNNCTNARYIELAGGSFTGVADYAFNNSGYSDAVVYNGVAYPKNGWIVKIPASVTSIGQYAFEGSYGPGKQLYIVTQKYSATDVMFRSYSDYITLIYDGMGVDDPTWMYRPASFGGVNGYEITGYLDYTKTNIVIPDTLGGYNVIGVGQGNWGVSNEQEMAGQHPTSQATRLTIPNTVYYIGENAFRGNNRLQEIVFTTGSHLMNIGKNAFTGAALPELKLPNSLVSIDDHAFDSTTGLNTRDGIVVSDITLVVTDGGAAEALVIAHNAKVDERKDSTLQYWDYRVISNTDYDFDYELYNGGVVITGYTGRNTVMSIPETIDGMDVVAIANEAFYNENNVQGLNFVTRAYIPATVSEIGDYAFAYMSGLQTVEFGLTGSQLVSIGDYAFAQTALTGELSLPDTLAEVGVHAFDTRNRTVYTRLKNGLDNGMASVLQGSYLSIRPAMENGAVPQDYKDEDPYGLQYGEDGRIELLHYFETDQYITLPERVQSIGMNAFAAAQVIRVTLPAGLEVIGEKAFAGCSQLQSLNLEETQVSVIGSKAFANCTAMNTLSLPYCSYDPNTDSYSGYNTVDEIYTDTFYGSERFVYVLMWKGSAASDILSGGDDQNPTYVSKITYYDDMGSSQSGQFVFSADGATVVAYRGLLEGDTLNVPAMNGDVAVTAIGANAFSGLRGQVTTVNLPESITAIGNQAFENMTNLTSVNIPTSLETIGSRAFAGTPLTSLDLSGTAMTSLGDYSLSGMTALTTVTLPEAMTSIGSNAFLNDAALTTVYPFTGALTSIGADAFSGTALTALDLESTSLTEISDYALENMSQLVAVTIPETVNRIGTHAFCNDPLLQNVELPNGVTEIGSYAFADCASITDINIPASLVTIGDYAFSGTSLSQDLTMPASLTGIGANAFAGTTFTTLDLSAVSDSVSLNANALTDSSITHVIVGGRNSAMGQWARNWAAGDPARSVSYSDDPTSILRLPAYLTTIESEAFAGINVGRVVIPETVTTIEANAFYGAHVDELVFEGNNYRGISMDAFNGMNNGEKVMAYVTSENNLYQYLRLMFSDILDVQVETFD